MAVRTPAWVCLVLLGTRSVRSFRAPPCRRGWTPPTVRDTNGLTLHAERAPSAGSAENASDRRDFVALAGAALLSAVVGVRSAFAEPAAAEEQKTVLVTGANSGIGFEACRIFAKQGHRVIAACRSIGKAEATAESVNSEVGDGRVVAAECDLADLASVKAFADSLPVDKLDIVCLNAGVALNTSEKQVRRTKDGFELTVGTNHLGHFYLSHLLLPMVAHNGRIVVTASGVHDPDSPGGSQGKTATLGNLQGLIRDGKNFEMVDGEEYNADKAYKDSKLCNVFFTRELQQRLQNNDATKGIVVNCFSPGLITSTGLFRNQNAFFSTLFDFAASKLFRVAETPEWGGASLVYVASQDTRGQYYLSPPGSSKYGDAAFGNQFKASPVSKEAQDDEKGKLLWKLSEQLVGIV